MGRDHVTVETSMPGANLADGWRKIVGPIPRAGHHLLIVVHAPAVARNPTFAADHNV
jgi:hypothetical protein